MLSGGSWNPYYRPAWRSAAAQLRTSGIDTYITGVLPQDGSSYFRDISGLPSKAYDASTINEMNSYRPEMIRQIVFGGIAIFQWFFFCFSLSYSRELTTDQVHILSLRSVDDNLER